MSLLLLLTMMIQPITGPAGRVSPAVAAAIHTPLFDGDRAYEHLVQQCDFGPRPPGSENLSLCRQYIVDRLRDQGWTVELQNFTYHEVACSNVIAYWGTRNATLIVGAHYDTRPVADHDPAPENRSRPILGANDGASGTAVILELARILPEDIRSDVEFVLFDAEDSGYYQDWSWIVGSTHYVDVMPSNRRATVRAMVLLDMVGDAELRLPREGCSTRSLQDQIWSIASSLGHDDVFLDTLGATILDDHRPFLDIGIPAVDIIQHNPFPWYWHTLEDTPDKCSADSLSAVGGVVETFLVETAHSETTYPPNSPLSDLPYLGILAAPVFILLVVIVVRRRRTSL